jgi:hypothetical protein
MSILDDVSKGLSGHFDELRISRRAVGGRVYALEHPLNHQELAELRKQLDIACAKFGLVSEHRLAWIVFATECGYEYSGLEYWPKLERYISSWQFGDRERLRKFFESFAKEFDGAATSGAWARQFSVIAWPITHAILPRDLQVHLSQALYLARHYLLGLEDFSNVYVGEVIAEHAPAYGDRFQRFIRQHEFVGAIAKQLLYASNTVEMFGERTFHRIVSDLEKHAEARYWLREACSHVKPKVKVALGPQSTKTREPQSNERLPTSLAPALAMRKDDSGSWALYLYPPSLINYLQQQPTLKPSASATRFSILGGAARQMFRVRDLICANPRERRLQNFPSSGTPLIVCDPADSSLARLLQEESVLLPRETWVFRISRDGTAWLQMSPTVSPGNKYLLANDATKTELPGEEQCAPYSGVRLTRFEVPTVLTDRDAEHLDQFGLSVNRTTTVSSWGLQPRRWDSGESAEFVEGEAIFLRIERDHSFDLLRCTLDSEEAMEYTWQGDGECIIELCGLSVGGHSIRIDTCQKIQSRGCTTMQTLSTFCLCFDVRPPSTWQPYQIPYEAIVIEISPDVPTLEEVLGNQIAVVVQGQASDPVDVELVLADEVDEYRHLVCHRRLPILKEEWRSKLETALQHEDIALHALAADRGYLLVRSERFGTHRVSLSVFPKPVRWKISSVSALGLQLCLYCEGLEEPTVQHYSFDAPARPQQIPFQELSGGITCANGLFVATMDGEEASIAVSSVPRTVRGLDELRVVVETPDVSSDSIDELARAYQQWAKAFAAGRHIHIRRQQIMDAIQERIVGQIAGVDWVKYEHCSHKKDAWELLEDHVSPSNRNYGITLGKRRGLIRESELREAFRSASVDYRITNDAALIQAAWAIAFDPSQLPSGWSPPTGGELQCIVTLVRGARLMKLGHVASAS